MTDTTIRMYGANWCGDCRRAKKFFSDYGIEYEWIDIDRDKEAEKIVRQVNGGNRSIPTIFFPDDSILVEPSYQELARKMGINENSPR